jgi:hypothetical protein
MAAVGVKPILTNRIAFEGGPSNKAGMLASKQNAAIGTSLYRRIVEVRLTDVCFLNISSLLFLAAKKSHIRK